MARVAVVGAGLAGLTAAIYLQRNGADVTVFESSDRVGGRVTSDLIDGFICDRGFQVINPSYSEIRRLNALSGIDFCAINPNIRIDGKKYGLSHPIATFGAITKLKDRVLTPFLRGVFLTDPDSVNPDIAREIKRSFILGRPGVPKYGVGSFAENLADQVSDIQLNATVQNIKNGSVKGDFGTEKFDAIIVSTDPMTATNLTGVKDYESVLPSFTWYHTTKTEIADSKYLAIDTTSPLVNSVVISETSPAYAPTGFSLIASTSLVKMSESEVRRDLAKIWKSDTKSWELVAKYDIKQSLPRRRNSIRLPQQIDEKLYLAGDHRDVPSQNGAMRSGRLAALAVISDLNLN